MSTVARLKRTSARLPVDDFVQLPEDLRDLEAAYTALAELYDSPSGFLLRLCCSLACQRFGTDSRSWMNL
jgi:hypothetical protein